ncbi:succinate--CoA ligase subunit alpha [Oceanispirochaeta sp.]|jgi:succinyl-CoA synthetase alpha subunit|uniref:succinate--CoA ligase subunit alpha n=1 Tax=Oceanispirochaeta sp. TaxID=2035350 RepID=UPI00262EF864|nr:succinate--CoA ligase subunit alpha [Oceanispirochaeta sp.]MDA3957546.1 succinate--CoA ligase subunit alpha [Oceanispirochaeta sp.]
MSILLNEHTKVIVQGITGRDGSFHTMTMVGDGTKIVAGVTPGKGGQNLEGIPVYNSVADCLKEQQVDASVVFVPAPYAAAAVREALEAAIPLVVCITEGIPVKDMTDLYHRARQKGSVLIGPNCPGLISPGKSKIGIMPKRIHKAGGIGVISRSGTLTYEVVNELTLAGMGQSTCIGIGGDPIVGTGFVDLLERFEADPDTTAVVLIGEIGGEAEEEAAQFIKGKMTKPVVAFISGRSAPKGKRMGHAGAIISGGKGTAEAKIAAFEAAGVDVADKPDEIPGLIKKKLN